MDVFTGLALAVAGLSLLFWAAALAANLRVAASTPRLGALEPPAPATWPRLSVISPACDEAERVEVSLRSLLRQGYPALEVVAVDDRSTDGTGAIIDRLAAGDDRLTAAHVDALPEGWLGKLNALRRGVEASGGEWLLFADADVEFAPGALERAVAWAEAEGLDYVTAHPEILSAGFAGDTLFSAMGSVYDASPGLAWLRLEVADDIGMGLLIKRAGGADRAGASGLALAGAAGPGRGGGGGGLEPGLRSLGAPAAGAGAAPPGGHAADGLADAAIGLDRLAPGRDHMARAALPDVRAQGDAAGEALTLVGHADALAVAVGLALGRRRAVVVGLTDGRADLVVGEDVVDARAADGVLGAVGLTVAVDLAERRPPEAALLALRALGRRLALLAGDVRRGAVLREALFVVAGGGEQLIRAAGDGEGGEEEEQSHGGAPWQAAPLAGAALT